MGDVNSIPAAEPHVIVFQLKGCIEVDKLNPVFLGIIPAPANDPNKIKDEEDQPGNEGPEELLPGVQKEEPSQDSADDAGREDQPQTALLPPQVVPLGERPAEVPRTERHRVRHVRGDGRHAQRDEHREGDQRAAARQGVDGPGADRGQRGEEELDRCEHRGFLLPCRGARTGWETPEPLAARAAGVGGWQARG